jgi:hypothetical protein
VGVGRYSRGPKFAIAAVTYLPGQRDATLRSPAPEMPAHPLPLLALAAASVAACAAAALTASARRGAVGSLTLEQRLAQSLLQAAEGGQELPLPRAFAQSLLQEADATDRGDRGHCCTGVVLDRPYVRILAAQLEKCLDGGVWPAPPAVENAELLALELDSSADHSRWAAMVLSTLACEADRATICALLAALGTQGVASLLGQRYAGPLRLATLLHVSCCHPVARLPLPFLAAL